MTTIAYRSHQMATDSSCFVGDTNVLTMRKVWRVGGGLVGCAGDVAEIFAFVRWLKDGADYNEYPEMKNMEALVVDPFGTIRAYEGETPEPIVIRNEYCAIGAGRDIALGAMYAGADARTAVKAAVRHSGQSKPPVRVFRLKK